MPSCGAVNAAASVARCQRSWCSTSDTAAPSLTRNWVFSDANTLRFPLRSLVAGKCRWISSRATKALRSALRRGELALDAAGGEDLDLIALLHVRVVLQHDAALEPGGDLADVVGVAAQRGDLACVDDGAVAEQTAPGAPGDLALGDVGTGDRAHAGGAEDRADLDVAEGVLDLLGLEHALHRRADLLERAVDDRVGADLDALALGEQAGLADGPDVEAEDDRVGGGGEHDVGFVDAADAARDDADHDLVLRQAGDLVLDGLEGAGHVGLDDEVDLAGAGGHEVLEAHGAAGLAGLHLALEALAALLGELAGATVVLDDAHRLAGVGHGVPAEDLDGHAGPRLAHAVPTEVVHRAHAAPVGAGDDRVAALQRAAGDEDGGDGAAARIELGLDDRARGVGLRVRPELFHLGHDEDRLEQLVEALVGLGRHVDELGVAAPVDGLEALAGHLAADAVRVRALLVDLVHRDEDRDLGGLGVVDRLLGLRLDAVVGGDHDDRDVGDLRAAGAHGGERLVARGVEEGDRLAVVVHLVGADVLGDAAGLTRGDLGLADRVEQRGLAVVDVAHDGHDGRALDEILVGVLEGGLGLALGLVGGDHLDLAVELGGDEAHRVVREGLGERRHLAHHHQLLDDLGHGHVQVLGDLLDGGPGGDPDRLGARVVGRLEGRRLVVLEVAPALAAAAARLAPALARRRTAGATGAAGTAPRGLRVDDDTPPAAGAVGRGRALALERVTGRALLLAVLAELGRAVAARIGGRLARRGLRGPRGDLGAARRAAGRRARGALWRGAALGAAGPVAAGSGGATT